MYKKKQVVISILLAFILFVAGFYYFFFLRLVRVPTGSMKNTILPGDRLAVNLLFGAINRGDIVVFRYPQDTNVMFVMRVIGLPGERIQLRDEKVYINGEELPEKRLTVEPEDLPAANPLKEISSDGEGSYHACYYSKNPSPLFQGENGIFAVKEAFDIPNDSYFVMGDNRDNSLDSRFWGAVARRLIVGKPFMIYWSVDPSDKSGEGKTRGDRVFSKLK